MKNLLLVQPGAFGDIFLCAPIAKYYFDIGYNVFWPTTLKFKKIIDRFPYVNHILISDDQLDQDWLRSDVMKIIPMFDKYDKVINLADRGPHPTSQLGNENFELCKYRLSEVPIYYKHNLKWERDHNKEVSIFKKLNLNPEEDYAVYHTQDSSGQRSQLPKINIKKIEVKQIDGYDIVDWFLVFLNAKEIYCTESSIHQFLDGIVDKITPNRFLLKRPCCDSRTRLTISYNWCLKYMDKNSIIVG